MSPTELEAKNTKLATDLREVAQDIVSRAMVVVCEDGDGASVCADASAAAAEKTIARHSLFTVFLDLGEIEISNLLYGAG